MRVTSAVTCFFGVDGAETSGVGTMTMTSSSRVTSAVTCFFGVDVWTGSSIQQNLDYPDPFVLEPCQITEYTSTLGK